MAGYGTGRYGLGPYGVGEGGTAALAGGRGSTEVAAYTARTEGSSGAGSTGVAGLGGASQWR